MKVEPINSKEAPDPSGGYAQAVSVAGAARTLYISGQIPVAADGSVPEGFADQARLAWRNLEAQLKAAGMGLEHIVKHTTYLADRRDREENSRVRREILGDLTPALTVVITDLYDERWRLEVEAVAAV